MLHPDSPTSCDDLVSMDCIYQVLFKAVVFLKTYFESYISCFFENSFRTFWNPFDLIPTILASSINSGVVNHLARFICYLYCASSPPRSEYFALSSRAAKCARQNATLMSLGVGLLLSPARILIGLDSWKSSGKLSLRKCQVRLHDHFHRKVSAAHKWSIDSSSRISSGR